ncbi:MAG: hypothetical protein KF784_10845 [Fimbriimonadaceae bacterium]|nr:hypothetical protein [Fimbriimonadaceae bacterium]
MNAEWLDYQRRQDQEHLRLLNLFHRIYAGIVTLFSCFGLLYIAFGVTVLSGNMPEGKNSPGDERFMGFIMTFFGSGFVVVALAYAILNWIASNRYVERRGKTFLIVVAAINCLNAPVGLLLGVFSLVVLMRPTVAELFDPQSVVPTQSDEPPEAVTDV